MMRLRLRTEDVQFQVTGMPSPKTDQQGKQRFERDSGLPMWSLEVLALEAKGGSILNVTVVADTCPQVVQGQLVDLVDLEALPWANQTDRKEIRSGVAFRASQVRVLAPVG